MKTMLIVIQDDADHAQAKALIEKLPCERGIDRQRAVRPHRSSHANSDGDHRNSV